MLALTKELPCSERGGAWGPWFSTSRGLGKVQYIPYQLRESTWRTLYVQQRRREAEGRLVAAWGLLRVRAEVPRRGKVESGTCGQAAEVALLVQGTLSLPTAIRALSLLPLTQGRGGFLSSGGPFGLSQRRGTLPSCSSYTLVWGKPRRENRSAQPSSRTALVARAVRTRTAFLFSLATAAAPASSLGLPGPWALATEGMWPAA